MAVDSPTGRRTQQERRERTESALITAAAELVVETGLRSLTLARVGERAGYSRGIVNHHFGSKQALVEALAHATQTGFVPGIDRIAPGLERLLAVVERYIGALGGVTVINRAFLLLWAEAATAPELTEIFRDRDEGFRTRLRADVEAAIAEGSVRPDTDPGDVAIAIMGQLRGIGLQRLLDPDAIDTERLRHVVAAQWRRALTMSD
ncbi:TetR/AcrR family transcriptional regulator [Umezawaea endophytica]|uniref:TetR family transcriptional regulator n=1 Tax=Umezawaea endophytica TaxID=1654476 RepID=A0A9X3A0E7_9PSEU|nr:TetR/AcrR family transcriptional regulator [Umezawaea endophytica]MCS7478484.1 TetR family transcriptional regulator [Umezawaea endophytica]